MTPSSPTCSTGYSPTVVVVEQTAAGVSLPSGLGRRVVVGSATGAEIDYEQLVAESADDPVDQVIGLDDVCMLPHTSGTTGAPKGVMLTHGNITWNVINLLSVVDFRSDDVTIAITPFFRTGGTGVNVLPVLFSGGTVIIPEAADPDEILRLIDGAARHDRIREPGSARGAHAIAGLANGRLLERPLLHHRWRTRPGAPHPDVHATRCHVPAGVRALRGRAIRVAPRSSKCAPQGRVRRQAGPVRRYPD